MKLASTLFLAPLLLSLSTAAAFAAEYGFKETAGQHLDVLRDGKVIARYMLAYDTSTKEKIHDTYKPYLHVFDADGSSPITKGPGGDFTHHRGIFEGWNKLLVGGKTYDRWHMKGGAQVHAKFLEQKADAEGATFTSLVKWQGEGEAVEPVLEDERTFRFLPASSPYYSIIDVTTKLKAIGGDTTFDGDPEHAGLQFRPAQEVDRTKTTYLYPKAKADAHKDLDYPWFAETYTLNGKTYSVVYLNHASNPTGTRISAYRDYGRFGAFFKTSIKKDEVLTLKVRFLIAEGVLPSAELIQKSWNEYSGKSDATPEVTPKAAEGSKAPARPKALEQKKEDPAKAKSN
ncbi:MAG: DUF6807 family protein [Verrucomicrobium sp.]|nr:DUF6807 family protein [Verrucomicrobium sp.]